MEFGRKEEFIHPVLASLNSTSNENKMQLLMLYALLHFLPLLISLKIPPSIIRGGFVSKFVLFILKAEALQVLGSSENNL